MRFRSLGALGASVGLAVLLVTSAFGLAGGAAAKDRTTAQKSHASATTYIVQLADDPAVAYTGSVAGYEATKPAKGKKINPNSSSVQQYASYLDGKHAEAASGRRRREVLRLPLHLQRLRREDDRGAGRQARPARRAW